MIIVFSVPAVRIILICIFKNAMGKEHFHFLDRNVYKLSQRQKGGDLTQSYDKSPYTNRNVKGAK